MAIRGYKKVAGLSTTDKLERGALVLSSVSVRSILLLSSYSEADVFY